MAARPRRDSEANLQRIASVIDRLADVVDECVGLIVSAIDFACSSAIVLFLMATTRRRRDTPEQTFKTIVGRKIRDADRAILVLAAPILDALGTAAPRWDRPHVGAAFIACDCDPKLTLRALSRAYGLLASTRDRDDIDAAALIAHGVREARAVPYDPNFFWEPTASELQKFDAGRDAA